MASSLESPYTGSSGTTFEASSQDIEAIDTLIAGTRKEAARFRNAGPVPAQTQAPPKTPTATNRKRKATQNLREGTQHNDQVQVDNTKLMLNQILMKMGEILNNQHRAQETQEKSAKALKEMGERQTKNDQIMDFFFYFFFCFIHTRMRPFRGMAVC